MNDGGVGGWRCRGRYRLFLVVPLVSTSSEIISPSTGFAVVCFNERIASRLFNLLAFLPFVPYPHTLTPPIMRSVYVGVEVI